jgi:hypothetical protein
MILVVGVAVAVGLTARASTSTVVTVVKNDNGRVSREEIEISDEPTKVVTYVSILTLGDEAHVDDFEATTNVAWQLVSTSVYTAKVTGCYAYSFLGKECGAKGGESPGIESSRKITVNGTDVLHISNDTASTSWNFFMEAARKELTAGSVYTNEVWTKPNSASGSTNKVVRYEGFWFRAELSCVSD